MGEEAILDDDLILIGYSVESEARTDLPLLLDRQAEVSRAHLSLLQRFLQHRIQPLHTASFCLVRSIRLSCPPSIAHRRRRRLFWLHINPVATLNSQNHPPTSYITRRCQCNRVTSDSGPPQIYRGRCRPQYPLFDFATDSPSHLVCPQTR